MPEVRGPQDIRPVRLLGWGIALGLLAYVSPAASQRLVRYGAEFLRLGAGAEAAGMGQAGLTLRADVTAGYWNPAGLVGLEGPQIGYMHVEQFGGLLQYDYAAVALRLDARSAMALSLLRLGADEIRNTLAAWDSERGVPLPERVTTFSVVDYALLFAYGRSLGSTRWTGGLLFKVLYGRIGPFASAWGASLDLGVQHSGGPWRAAVVIADLTTLARIWHVRAEALEGLSSAYRDSLPQSLTELSLPTLRLGLRYERPLGSGIGGASVELDLQAAAARAYVPSLGPIGLEPRLGMFYNYRQALILRAGLEQIARRPRSWVLTPTVGLGVRIRAFRFDYALGHFAGLRELGPSHRLSLVLQWPPW